MITLKSTRVCCYCRKRITIGTFLKIVFNRGYGHVNCHNKTKIEWHKTEIQKLEDEISIVNAMS